jgi:hypothetical protein
MEVAAAARAAPGAFRGAMSSTPRAMPEIHEFVPLEARAKTARFGGPSKRSEHLGAW